MTWSPKRFLAVFYPAAEFPRGPFGLPGSKTEPFKSVGKVLVDPQAWLTVYGPRSHRRRHTHSHSRCSRPKSVCSPREIEVKQSLTQAPLPVSPKPTLLSAMEGAGKFLSRTKKLREAMSEKKGARKPPPRAPPIIEGPAQRGQYLLRQGKDLQAHGQGPFCLDGNCSTAWGIPETHQNPKLTGDWEYRLRQVPAPPKRAAPSFMAEIAEMTRPHRRTAPKKIRARHHPGRFSACSRKLCPQMRRRSP